MVWKMVTDSEYSGNKVPAVDQKRRRVSTAHAEFRNILATAPSATTQPTTCIQTGLQTTFINHSQAWVGGTGHHANQSQSLEFPPKTGNP